MSCRNTGPEADEQELMAIMDEILLQKSQGVSQETLDSLYLCAWNLYQQRKLDESETLFRFLSLWHAENKDYLLGLAAVYQLKKKYHRAIALYNAAHLIDPQELRPVLQMGYCHLLLKQKGKARTCFERVVSSSQNLQLRQAAQDYLDGIDGNKTENRQGV